MEKSALSDQACDYFSEGVSIFVVNFVQKLCKLL